MVTQKKLEGLLSPLEERIQALEAAQMEKIADEKSSSVTCILSVSKDRFHRLSCVALDLCHDNHVLPVSWSRDQCIENHFQPCKRCNP